ncbi:IS3 family transposase [Flavobacterium sp. ANB]|uniref:IS3 family transposase n=1 Tax=unclassified Flavobacterium TaxID=196869 RepID=UPI0012B6B7A5|nr:MULTISPECIES: IS3 family transposase [unclassified Flavobacterium]MBF4515800.1 IS3 family transposase [Flavobacterium sp. ANB]MTD68803.1 IS3 family transposase [Flavobacterium sp. LC2016-13]
MKTYERTFKENAVKLSYERGKGQIVNIERELGITPSCLNRWRQDFEKFGTGSFCGTGYLKLTPDQAIITTLEKKIKNSELTLEILKSGSKYVAQGKVMTKEFIENNKHKFSILKMCDALQVSRTTYYLRKKQELSGTEIRINLLKDEITSIFYENKQRYGCTKIAKELEKKGFILCSSQVNIYMNILGLRSRPKRKYKPTTDSNHNHYVSPNVLNREFKVSEPAKVWVSDITYIQTMRGFVYLTIVMDLFDRKIIGWSLSDTMSTKQTTLSAWEMAVKNRKISKDLIFHSDRGSQYANKIFTDTLDSYKCVRRSMSRRQNNYDNAVSESFFNCFKAELIRGTKLLTRKQMKLDVIEYIENWYNKKRRHSYLGFKTIEEFENINKSLYGVVV